MAEMLTETFSHLARRPILAFHTRNPNLTNFLIFGNTMETFPRSTGTVVAAENAAVNHLDTRQEQ